MGPRKKKQGTRARPLKPTPPLGEAAAPVKHDLAAGEPGAGLALGCRDHFPGPGGRGEADVLDAGRGLAKALRVGRRGRPAGGARGMQHAQVEGGAALGGGEIEASGADHDPDRSVGLGQSRGRRKAGRENRGKGDGLHGNVSRFCSGPANAGATAV